MPFTPMKITFSRLFLFVVFLSFSFSSSLYAKAKLTLPEGASFSSHYFEDFRSYAWPVKIAYRGNGYHAFFEKDSVLFKFYSSECMAAPSCAQGSNEVRLHFKHGNSEVDIQTLAPQAVVSNYFLGYLPGSRSLKPDEHVKSLANIQRYGRIVYKNIYDHIDLYFYLNGDDIEYDFIVEPGGHPEDIQLDFSGMDSLKEDKGSLIIRKNFSSLIHKIPKIYQYVGSKKQAVLGRYQIEKITQNRANISFNVSLYDASLPLIIDPVLTHVSYYGGSDNDEIVDIALDKQGNLYVLGTTLSVDIPVNNKALQANINGLEDLFVAKFTVDKDGFKQKFSTYIGGSSADLSEALAVDALGNVYVTGTTRSTDFPISRASSQQAFQTALQGGKDTFILRLNKNGSLIDHATFFGGSGDDIAKDIRLLSNGNVVVAGNTRSNNLILALNPLQASLAGGSDLFLVYFDAGLSRLVFSSYLGGSQDDTLTAITLDNADNVYLTGETLSTDFPRNTSIASLQSQNKGGGDVFVSKVNAQHTLSYSTYLGGKYRDVATGIAVNTRGEAYIYGFTESPDFPVTPRVWQSHIADDTSVLDPLQGGINDPLNPIGDLFLSQLDNFGQILLYSTYIGGVGNELSGELDIDEANLLYITGRTTSSNLFIRNVSGSANVSGNAFGAVFDTTKSFNAALVFSSIMTGNFSDIGRAIVANSTDGSFYMAGSTKSNTLNALNALQFSHGGGTSDAFIAKFGIGVDVDAFIGFLQGVVPPVGAELETTFVHSVVNHGPDIATNIKVEMTIPQNVQFNRIRVQQGATDCGTGIPDQNLKIFCTIDSLNKEDSARIDLIVTAPVAEIGNTLTFHIYAQAEQADINSRNNQHTFQTTVDSEPGKFNASVPDATLKPGAGFSLYLLFFLVWLSWKNLPVYRSKLAR